MTAKQRVLLYLDAMSNIMSAQIKFERTSLKPLVLYAIFLRNNRFKDHCKMVLKHFDIQRSNIQWGTVRMTRSERKNGKSTSIYVQNRNRAKDLHSELMNHLEVIRAQIEECNDMTVIENARQQFERWTENSYVNYVHIKYTACALQHL